MPASPAPLRIGILGAAAIAPAALVKPARSLDGVEVTAVAARDVRRARAFAARHGIGRVHLTYEDLLADPAVDAVYIPLPNGLHGAWTVAALDAGKHVLCEKPFAANASEAALVAARAEHGDRVVMEAFHWRYHPLSVHAIEVATTELGVLRHVSATFAFPLLKRHDIRWSRELAGGGLLDAGCYSVHQIRTIGVAATGREPEVVGATARLTAAGVDRALRAELRFTDTLTASMRCGLLDPRRPIGISLRVEGSDGSLVYRNPVLPHLGGHVVVRSTRGRRRTWAQRTPSYTYQLRAFVDAVATGEPFPTTARDAVANMTTIDAIERAAGIVPPQPAAP